MRIVSQIWLAGDVYIDRRFIFCYGVWRGDFVCTIMRLRDYEIVFLDMDGMEG